MAAWFDEVDALLEAAGGADTILWPAALVSRAPEDALDIVAHQIDLRMWGVPGEGPVDARHLRTLLAALLRARGEVDPRCDAISPSRRQAIEAFLEAPAEATWRTLVATTPGPTPVDRARRALHWVLAHGQAVDRVVRVLSRRGPVSALEDIARTGFVSQFDFGDRAQRTKVPERKKAWLALAVLAAEARGAGCCVATFGLALEALDPEAAKRVWSEARA